MKQEKIYTLYKTSDERKEIKVCYQTSTAYLITDGKVKKIDDVTLEIISNIISDLEKYDELNLK